MVNQFLLSRLDIAQGSTGNEMRLELIANSNDIVVGVLKKLDVECLPPSNLLPLEVIHLKPAT
jgi:hypothetical protein